MLICDTLSRIVEVTLAEQSDLIVRLIAGSIYVFHLHVSCGSCTHGGGCLMP
jgi:hypothetical protein